MSLCTMSLILTTHRAEHAGTHALTLNMNLSLELTQETLCQGHLS